MHQEVIVREQAKCKASASSLFRLRTRTNGCKNLLLLIFAATLLGCPPVKVTPSLGIISSLYSDMMVLKSLNAKSIIETKYSVVEKSGEFVKGEFKYSEEMIFNDKGDSVIINSYNESGTFNWKRTCIFDSTKLIEVNMDSSDGSPLNKIGYFYDENGNLLEINEYNSNYLPIYKTSYWYDINKNMLVINDYSCDFRTGEKPPLIHETKITHGFDEQGKTTESRYYDRNDSLVNEKYYSYNDSGYVITEYIKRDTVKAAASPTKITYRHDINGRLLEKNAYNPNGELSGKTTYQYEFDKNNIWIKQTEFFLPSETGKAYQVSLTERKIEYYD